MRMCFVLTGSVSSQVIPYTLAENAGLNPIAIVTELRNRHAAGDTLAGINVRKVRRCTRSGLSRPRRKG
jgi:chaperonin GroEL (HSP60 family)